MVNFGLSAQDFNSHAHVERDQPYKISDDFSDNFNSHAHVERDFSLVKTEIREQAISTHTLTWSVTCLGR